MSQRIHDKIRETIEKTPGLTPKGLAERMGLNPAAVNRMLYGRRNIMAEEIPIIENYLGLRLDLSGSSSSNLEYLQPAVAVRRGFSDVAAQPLSSHTAAQMVPVYGYDAAGLHLSEEKIVDWALRHPAQFGINNAFAIYVTTDAMEPRYFSGELVYIHPGRPPEVNRDCLLETKDGEVSIRRFLRQADGKVRVAQLNPQREKDIARDNIKSIYAVVGRG